MATRKKQAPRNKNAVTIELSMRHLWLASLGMLVATRRESNAAVKRVVAKADRVASDARQAVTRTQADLRGNIDGVRSQVQPKVMKFSSEVEARLAPVLAKLGLKPLAKRAPRKVRKTAAKAPRRTARKPTKRAAKQATN